MEVPLLQGDFSYIVKGYPSICRETPFLNLQIKECVASQISHLPRKNSQSRSLSFLRVTFLILFIHCFAPNKFYFNQLEFVLLFIDPKEFDLLNN